MLLTVIQDTCLSLLAFHASNDSPQVAGVSTVSLSILTPLTDGRQGSIPRVGIIFALARPVRVSFDAFGRS